MSAQTYGVGTMPIGTLNYTSGAAIASVMQQRLAMQTRVQPNSGASVLLPLVNTGEVDFGIANILEVVAAYEGKAVAGKQDKLRIVGAIHPLRVGFFVRKGSGIETVADLRGKRVSLGFSAMRTSHLFALAVLATGGLTENDVRPVLVPNVVRAADDVESGSSDAFIFAIGGSKVAQVDASTGGLRLVAVPDSPEGLAAARKIFPYAYLTEVSPRSGLTGVLAPTKILTYDNILVTGEEVKEEIVYNVLDGLMRNKPDLVATAPWLDELDADKLYKEFPVPYHPGAVRWFREKGFKQK